MNQATEPRRRRKGGKKIANFYTEQNDHIDNLLKSMSAHTEEAAANAESSSLQVKIAINVSFGANIVLAIVQLYAAISSGSLALFASCIDAVCESTMTLRKAVLNVQSIHLPTSFFG